jgi:hypothetical protein
VKTKRISRRDFLIALSPLALLALLFFGFCFYVFYTRIPPKEASLLQNFNKHRATFEQLRDMLIVDTNLSRVGRWGVQTRKPLFLGWPLDEDFPKDRFNKYLALLKEAGAKGAARGEGEPADPSILVWVWGWAGTTRHIGVCWLNESPTNQVATLDGYIGPSKDSVAFRHIDSNWYFWTDL